MKKGTNLYIAFAALCVVALAVCFAGCKGKEVSNISSGSTDTSAEGVYSGEDLIESRYDNGDYDRNNVSNANSKFVLPEDRESSDADRKQHKPSVSSGSSSKANSSKANSSKANSSKADSSKPGPSVSSRTDSSKTSSTKSIITSRDDGGYTSRWY